MQNDGKETGHQIGRMSKITTEMYKANKKQTRYCDIKKNSKRSKVLTRFI